MRPTIEQMTEYFNEMYCQVCGHYRSQYYDYGGHEKLLQLFVEGIKAAALRSFKKWFVKWNSQFHEYRIKMSLETFNNLVESFIEKELARGQSE